MQLGAERLNVNNFTNMGYLLGDFFTSFDYEKNKTLEGYIKIHGIFRTLVYPKLWHIQNQDIFKILGYYSESWDVQNRRHPQNLVKHLRWSVLRNS